MARRTGYRDRIASFSRRRAPHPTFRHRELRADTRRARGDHDGGIKVVSCPDSLRFAHDMRASHEAGPVGAGTVCKDDPRLTVRHVPGTSPLRVVLDQHPAHTPEAAVLLTARPGNGA